ncbi:MAG: undecaprenyl-diphosphate phosphatase, partial [Mucispirillum sp.]|nr:undecaprenyl-diphosphate phosphatase [Mucispirillum sp.]
MDTVSAVILGLLQGLTEFLPISSSGHLAIGKRLLDFNSPDILFDVLLHAATLCAVLIFFRRRVMLIIKAFLGIFFKRFSLHYFENKRFLWGIVIASVPTGILGLLFKEYLLDYFQVTLFVGYALIFTSFILIVSDNFNGSEKLTPLKSFLIGVAQGLAVIPGISRS